MLSCNTLKEHALQALMEETFSHVSQSVNEAHGSLAQENDVIRKTNMGFYMHNGKIFPQKQDKKLTSGRIPSLHYSLFENFGTIEGLWEKAGYTAIRTYFVTVLSNSFNSVVLEAMLPDILINKLRSEFSTLEFKLLNQGFHDGEPVESVGETWENVYKIKEHYQQTIVHLRNTLMDNLLLQG